MKALHGLSLGLGVDGIVNITSCQLVLTAPT